MKLGAYKQDRQRPSARERGYGTAWDKARVAFLRLHPHCARCADEGLIVVGTVVDHVIPHRGNQRLFWDQANWASLCGNHHSSDKQQQEKRGFSSRVNASGLPSDFSHPFYSGEDAARESGDGVPALRRSVQQPSRKVGTATLTDKSGRGPLGDNRTELVFGPEGPFEGAAAPPTASGDRASGSKVITTPSIVASPSLIRGRGNG